MTGAPRVLVLSADLDPTADAVLTHLLAREVPFTRLDPKVLLTGGSMSARLDRDGLWRGVLRGGPREIHLEQLRSVWVRRPGEITPPDGLDSAAADWCVGQAREALWGVLQALPHLRWVNPVGSARAASFSGGPALLRIWTGGIRAAHAVGIEDCGSPQVWREPFGRGGPVVTAVEQPRDVSTDVRGESGVDGIPLGGLEDHGRGG